MQLKSIASRAQCAWFEEQRVPRRRCCEPSGWGIDRPEGAAPGFLLPVILVPTALNVSCDDEDAVWPPEPREEAGLATDAHLFKEAFKESFRVTRRTISHYDYLTVKLYLVSDVYTNYKYCNTADPLSPMSDVKQHVKEAASGQHLGATWSNSEFRRRRHK